MAAVRFLLIAALLLPAIAVAGGARVADTVGHVFRAGSYSKAARIVSLTARDLSFASKSDNIDGLLRLANIERRVDPDPVVQSGLWARYNAIPSGDALLLRCLQSTTCDPSTCSGVAVLSELHAQVLLRRPDFDLTHTNQAVGSISEQVMIRHFQTTGWTRVEGQVGRTGMDGLFIKRNDDGKVRDVLIVESKYNTGTLQPTNHGMQMSREWLLKKLTELRKRFPDDSVYPEIEDYVDRGWYRARLWSMKLESSSMRIELQKVHSKGSDVDLLDDDGARVAAPPNSISLTQPRSGFERALVDQLRWELDKLGPKPNGS